MCIASILLAFGCSSPIRDRDWQVRSQAAEKLSDQRALAKVACEDEHWIVRREAVRKLTDQTILAKVAREDKHHEVRFSAAVRLTDQVALARVACEDEDTRVREIAVRKVEDSGVLAKVALKDDNWYVRKEATARVTDQAVLGKVACEDQKLEVRRAAFEKLDKSTLAILSTQAKDPAVSLAARVVLKQDSWDRIFENLSSLGTGNVLGAAALVVSPTPSTRSVVAACHRFIREGNEARIPELGDLLHRCA